MRTIVSTRLSKRAMISIVAALVSAALLFAAAAFAGCGQPSIEKPLDEVSVQLSWFHQTQFAGMYAADQRGYYAEEGLAVRLLPRPTPSFDAIASVLDGTADFALTNGVALIPPTQGDPVTAIAAIFQRYPLVYLTVAGSGITRPHDFPGYTIRAQSPNGAAIFRALMTHLGIDPNSVRYVETGYDMSPFFDGDVDIWPGYIIDEALLVRERGHQVNLILPDDYGIHTYGQTLFASERLISEEPDLVLRFLRATLKGWRWAIENTTEEVSALALEYEPELDIAHEAAMIEASVPLIHTGEDEIVWMRGEIWQGAHDILLEQGILSEPSEVDELYTMEFLHAIYGEQ